MTMRDFKHLLFKSMLKLLVDGRIVSVAVHYNISSSAATHSHSQMSTFLLSINVSMVCLCPLSVSMYISSMPCLLVHWTWAPLHGNLGQITYTYLPLSPTGALTPWGQWGHSPQYFLRYWGECPHSQSIVSPQYFLALRRDNVIQNRSWISPIAAFKSRQRRSGSCKTQKIGQRPVIGPGLHCGRIVPLPIPLYQFAPVLKTKLYNLAVGRHNGWGVNRRII